MARVLHSADFPCDRNFYFEEEWTGWNMWLTAVGRSEGFRQCGEIQVLCDLLSQKSAMVESGVAPPPNKVIRAGIYKQLYNMLKSANVGISAARRGVHYVYPDEFLDAVWAAYHDPGEEPSPKVEKANTYYVSVKDILNAAEK